MGTGVSFMKLTRKGGGRGGYSYVLKMYGILSGLNDRRDRYYTWIKLLHKSTL